MRTICFFLLICQPLFAQDAALQYVDVFSPKSDGYPAIRIPSLVTTHAGTLLAFAEGRQGGDHSENDIILKRSEDNGVTWSKIQVVNESGKLSLNNPQAVVLDSGRILLMYQQSKLGEHNAKPGFGEDAYVTFTQFSDDDGKTWSSPKDVTRQTKRAEHVTSVASGPGIGIVLSRGEHKGRILMPFNQGPFGDWRVYAAYSDDDGESWKIGEVPEEDGKGHANEVQMVELSDGSVMLNARTQGKGTTKHRKIAISKDGGVSWSKVKDDPTLIEPTCQAAILRYSWPEDGASRILFCNPATQKGRSAGLLRMSEDEGKTWTWSKEIYAGPFAYCCLTKMLDGRVGVLFEKDGYKTISFAAVKLPGVSDESAETKKDELPRSFSISEDAEVLGFNVKKLAKIDKEFSGLLKRQRIAGVTAIATRKGKEIFYGQWGFRDREKEIPLSRDSIVRIYSMTKPVTSVAVMQLVEQGKVKLDSAVSTYLPEFASLKVLEPSGGGKSKKVKPKRSMTVRDLLRHTSGLTYGFFGNTEVDKQYRAAGVLVTDISIKSTVEKLGNIPLQNHPGERFHYSVSSDVLGRLVEVVSGEKLDDYFSQNIFEPLGMADTFFSVPKEKQNRVMQLYANRRGKPLEVAAWHHSIRIMSPNNKFFSGGGGLCSTVNDYLAFSHMLLSKGASEGKRILSEQSVEQMFTNQLGKIDSPPGRGFKFGLGFRCFPQGDFGWGGAAGTKFWVHPEKETAIIYMIQMMPNEGPKFDRIVRDTVYSSLRIK
jgi:sialidase-1